MNKGIEGAPGRNRTSARGLGNAVLLRRRRVLAAYGEPVYEGRSAKRQLSDLTKDSLK
jgi:hypothetical protein